MNFILNHTEIIKLTIAKEKYTKYTDVITTNEAIKIKEILLEEKEKEKIRKRREYHKSLRCIGYCSNQG